MLDFISNLFDNLLYNSKQNRVSHSYTSRTNQDSDNNDLTELIRDVTEFFVKSK